MGQRVLVINPNSSQHVTDGLSAAVDCYRGAGVEFDCVTLTSGPPAVISHRDVAQVVMPMLELFETHKDKVAATVVACFYDPGLAVLRQVTRRPVFGIGESSFAVAMSMVDRFGLISASAASGARIDQRIRELGMGGRFVGGEPIGMSILDVKADPEAAWQRLQAAGRVLAGRGAEAVIMAGAAMTPFRTRFEDVLGIPAIDPVLSAAGLALSAALANRG